MRFHVVALPHTQTTKDFNACAYTQKVFNFCKMMTDLGHEVYHYGTEGSNPPCKEHITVITPQEQRELIGENDWKSDFFKIEWDPGKPYWVLANTRAGEEINKRKQRGDFVCLIGGDCQKLVSDIVGEAETITVEYGIGYKGTFAKYRVFESYAQMHKVYAVKDYNSDGKFFDAVVPNYFDPADFPYSKEKDDYYLFIGRFIQRKGIEIAAETVKRIGGKLKIAGQGVLKVDGNKIIGEELTIEGDHVEYVGYADIKKRGELMSRAKAVFVPTYYLGPFEGVNVEAQMCGTPVITTDWGAFPETVQHGVTGYRCRTLEQFVWAAKNVDKLDPEKIRNWAVNNYSLDRIARKYDEYFKMLLTLWGEGWYTIKDDRTELDWLKQYYE